jgi:hypothetical protein
VDPLVHAAERDRFVAEFRNDSLDVRAEAVRVVQRVGHPSGEVDRVRRRGDAVARAVDCDHWDVVGRQRPSNTQARDMHVRDEGRRPVERARRDGLDQVVVVQEVVGHIE